MAKADLARLADRRLQEEVGVYEGRRDGGGGRTRRPALVLRDAELDLRAGGLQVMFRLNGGHVDAVSEALGLPVDGAAFDTLAVRCVNGDEPATVEVCVLGSRGRMAGRKDLAPSQEATVALDVRDVPLAQGNQPAHCPTGIRIEALWGLHAGQTDFQRGFQRDEALAEGGPPRTLVIREIALMDTGKEKGPVVDRFGQRRRATWPGKVTADRQLREAAEAEGAALLAAAPRRDLDRYGGWTGGPRFEATGFFRLHADGGGPAWFVDPDGWPFWSLGATEVGYGNATITSGREELFAELPAAPAPQDAPGEVSFFSLNVARKWGGADRWRQHVTRRFKAWGLNTAACWSPMMYEQKEVPHTRYLVTRPEGVPLCCPKVPDVWDPRWRPMFEEHVRQGVGADADNPWILGWFVDNEIKMGFLQLWEAPPGAAARDAWLALARKSCAGPAAVNEMLGTSCETWEDVRLLRRSFTKAQIERCPLLLDFQVLYAEEYFRAVTEVLKACAPNHLYLGCRFVRNPPHDRIIRTAARYCEMLTVNCYATRADNREMLHWLSVSDRPILIGEHHHALIGPRQFPPPWPAAEPEEHEDCFAAFGRCWAAMPRALGLHWFSWVDQPITGRSIDGENQIIGFVDVTDQPHEELVRAARRIAREMYPVHAGAG